MSSMKLAMIGLSVLMMKSLVGCGTANNAVASAPGDGASTTGSPSKTYTMVVASEDELPACDDDNFKQLVYIKSTKTFKSCESGTWASVEIGSPTSSTTAGLTIQSNELLDPYNTNLCTLYSSIEQCYFNGGQLVKFTDGTILIMGGYSYAYFSPSSGASTAEYDRLSNSITMIVPPEVPNSYQRLDWEVSRSAGSLRNLYLVYSRALDRVALLFDSNNNRTPDASDEVVHVVTRSSW